MDEYLCSHQPWRLQREAAGLAEGKAALIQELILSIYPEWGVLPFPWNNLVVFCDLSSGAVQRFSFPYLSFSCNKSSTARNFLAAVVDITGQDTRLRRLVVGKHSSGRFAPIIGIKGGSWSWCSSMQGAGNNFWRDGEVSANISTRLRHTHLRCRQQKPLSLGASPLPYYAMQIMSTTTNLNSKYFHRNDVGVVALL